MLVITLMILILTLILLLIPVGCRHNHDDTDSNTYFATDTANHIDPGTHLVIDIHVYYHA